MRTHICLLVMLFSFSLPAIAQKKDSWPNPDTLTKYCDCSLKRIQGSTAERFKKGHLKRVVCNDKAYFFHVAQKDGVVGWPIMRSDSTVAMGPRAKISADTKRPYTDLYYALIDDPDTGETYRCDLETHKMTFCGKKLQTGESLGTEE